MVAMSVANSVLAAALDKCREHADRAPAATALRLALQAHLLLLNTGAESARCSCSCYSVA